MKVVTIKRRKHPKTVGILKVSELDTSKCSHKFNQLNLNPDEEVYVECDKDGNILYRGKKEEYRIYSVKDHKKVSLFDMAMFKIKSKFKNLTQR